MRREIRKLMDTNMKGTRPTILTQLKCQRENSAHRLHENFVTAASELPTMLKKKKKNTLNKRPYIKEFGGLPS